MKGWWAVLLAVVLGPVWGPGGVAGQVLPVVPLEMERLAWMVGEWEGAGWMEYGPGQRGEFRGTERVEHRMGDRLVVVEGSFTAYMGPGREAVPVHQAFGILDYDSRSGSFRFRTYTAFGPGAGGEHGAEVTDGGLVWGYEDPRMGTVRYTITRTDADEWLEVGDASRDGGATWHRFFEMRLARR